MSDQPEALRLADWLDGSSNGPMDARHKAADELRRLHEANEAFGKRQEWWNDRMFEMEAALRKTQKPVACQYAKDVSMPEYRCAVKCQYAQPAEQPIAWVYPEGLEALKSGKPWGAYGNDGDGRIPLYLHNDAVAPRAEPPISESGAGFESLPASPYKPTEQNT